MSSLSTNDAPTLPEADILRKATNDNKHAPISGTNIAIQTPAGKLPQGGASAPKRHTKTHPPPQLVDYLNSPSAAGPYTALEANRGLSTVTQQEKNMKERLEAWQQDWDKMAAANNKKK